jgi:Kef-type K+ transport system membrane component KefB
VPTAETFLTDLRYILLLFALFVVPKMLQRFRLPSAVTAVALGAVASLGFGMFQSDATVRLFATLGIASLFLFAGLEVDFHELRQQAAVLLQHVLIKVGALIAVALLVGETLDLPGRPAALVALALLTPSTGFILDSLGTLGVTERERFWIKSKAIAIELVALAALFVTLQSTTVRQLAYSTFILGVLVAILPLGFRFFSKLIAPHAPKSEFAFLIMLAVMSAFITYRLGVYYLVGAFIVGVIAQRFRSGLPAKASEQLVHAAEVFASVFVPFYFFSAGLHLRGEDFGFDAVLHGLAFLGLTVPFQVMSVALHRRLALKEPVAQGARVGLSMVPTLVFTLVIAEILRDRFGVSSGIFGGLIIYTLVNTLIPGFVLRAPPVEFETPQAPALQLPLPPPPDSPPVRQPFPQHEEVG